MIAKVIFEIIIDWLLMGAAVSLLFVLCYYFAIGCEKITASLTSIAKYLRARYNQP